MLGRRDPQRKLFSAAQQLGDEAIKKLGFYGKVASEGYKMFRDEDFVGAYCEGNRRPSVPPSVLTIALLLQHHDGVSDAEVIAKTQYDVRWKVALDLDLASIEPIFAKSTFQAFRARLTLHRLLSDAIAAVLRSIAARTAKPVEDVARDAELQRHVEAASIKGSETVDWSDASSVDAFLASLVSDCRTAIRLAEQSDCGADEVALLKKVIDQDIEDAGDGSPKIRRGEGPHGERARPRDAPRSQVHRQELQRPQGARGRRY
jgi:hypothetical protein